MGLSSGCADRDCARYWWLNDGSLWAIEEIKSPCNGRGFGGNKVNNLDSTYQTKTVKKARKQRYALRGVLATSHAFQLLIT